MSDEAESGRGLHLIAALTGGRLEHRERAPIGKTVSARLELKMGTQVRAFGLGYGSKIA